MAGSRLMSAKQPAVNVKARVNTIRST